MKSKKDLFFDKVSYQESALNAPDGVPVSTAFVYHETTRELLYVMEKIGTIWHYTNWKNIEKITSGKSSKKCNIAIDEDYYVWTRGGHTVRYRWDDNSYSEYQPKFSADGPIQWQGAPRRSNAYQFIYGANPHNEYSRLLYIKELRNKTWSFARWPGPQIAVGTIKECRDAIRADYLDKAIPESKSIESTVSTRYSFEVAGVHYRRESARRCSVNQCVRLKRDPRNEYDGNAIEVYCGSHIGFVPRDLARRIAPFLDSGAEYAATVAHVRKYQGDVSAITVSIEITRGI